MKNLYIQTVLSLLAIATTAKAQEADTIQVTPAQSIITPIAIDTIPTEDRFLRVVLFDDHTWEYIEIPRPQIDDDDFSDEWNNAKVHAYKGISMDSIPEIENILLTDSLHPYCCPLKGNVRSGYKWRKRRPHRGVDLPLITGTPIRAAFDGKVRVVMKTKQTGGYGNLIVIRHPNGLETYYGHLSVHKVKENDIVRAGEVIGLGGNTGRSTGPHLHFETRYMGQAFDPERLIDFKTGELRDSIFTFKKHYLSIYSHYGMTDQESIDASKRLIHKVRSGDTLGGIARKYGTTVAEICKLNKITAKKTLKIGQNLIVR
ncbi:MAG: peptidoglycan DD-metalloendopeptidase family protein [Bacteroidales bacterium]|nr:peptidoglycan DD-metalloendopeptidase family protein [Bacteroidales bacterium]